MNTNIIILIAGPVGFNASDGEYPLCLTEFEGISLIERIVANTRNIPNVKYIFALLDRDVERFHLDKVVKLLVQDAVVVKIPTGTNGSACTALLAASQLQNDDALLIISANELVDLDLNQYVSDFEKRKLDGGTLIFRSVHPRYSYVRINKDGFITEAAQQNPISNNATVGIFWFLKVRYFVDGAKNMIRKNASVGGKFYVMPTFNELILNHYRVGFCEIDATKYSPLKSERQVYQFEKSGAS
jgi:hypothetical protein